ncbi:MAG: hypothetical protein ABW087_17205 [Candidatus Thiodiazotropha sp.]
MAGYLPIATYEHRQIHRLQAPTSQILDNHRSLLTARARDLPNITTPRTVERDGYQYVEASEFLGWFAQYLAHTRTNLPFPDDLARQVAEETNSYTTKSEQVFESLTDALKGSFRPRSINLPEKLRLRVVRDLYPLEWDQMSPKERKTAAMEWDQQHETAVVQARQHWVNYYLQREPINRQLAKWESISTNSATELARQETQIADLRQQLRELDQQKSQQCNKLGQSEKKVVDGHQVNMQNGEDKTKGHKSNPKSYLDCLPSLPTKQNFWLLVIISAVNKFSNENGRCPSDTEVWNLLCNNTLSEYKITVSNDRGEISLATPGEKSLGRRSFKARWRRYTATK